MSNNDQRRRRKSQRPDLNDLYLFTLVVEQRSFTAAGRVAGLTTSRVSRRIAALEERLGVRLLHRSTRKLNLTPVGARYYEHCRAMVSEAEAAAEVVEQIQARPRGRVRVTCPTLMAQSTLAPIVVEFMRVYPEVQVTVAATDRLVDLIDEGFDVAIRFRALPLGDSTLVARALGESRNLMVAAPALLDAVGRPQSVPELARFRALAKTRHENLYAWQFTGPEGEAIELPFQPTLDSDDWLILKQAALAGLGIVAMPEDICAPELATGRLEAVLTDWTLPSAALHIVYASRRGLIPAVRSFVDFVAERLPLLRTADLR
ncbi:MAG: LysR substrate-binding domain-containing protein [Gammaproteobacteria bacterium]|jgi:DNA-binding transcriptional LysR family regulator|nr:LysR substrate-binding domain-containing protein [Gammaproteobacteria bacterium]